MYRASIFLPGFNGGRRQLCTDALADAVARASCEPRPVTKENDGTRCTVNANQQWRFRLSSRTWQALWGVPDNMLGLLQSPQGWLALAEFVACQMGVAMPDYSPTVH
jgi:hypothetical protein